MVSLFIGIQVSEQFWVIEKLTKFTKKYKKNPSLSRDKWIVGFIKLFSIQIIGQLYTWIFQLFQHLDTQIAKKAWIFIYPDIQLSGYHISIQEFALCSQIFRSHSLKCGIIMNHKILLIKSNYFLLHRNIRYQSKTYLFHHCKNFLLHKNIRYQKP